MSEKLLATVVIVGYFYLNKVRIGNAGDWPLSGELDENSGVDQWLAPSLIVPIVNGWMDRRQIIMLITPVGWSHKTKSTCCYTVAEGLHCLFPIMSFTVVISTTNQAKNYSK